jgi:hypothetical protein
VSLSYFAQALVFLSRRARGRRRTPAAERRAGEGGLLPISLITVLGNDEDVAEDYIETLMGLDYPTYEIIAVCDGSSDGTVKNLAAAYGLEAVSFPVRMRLKCSKIRTVYMNPEFPGFTLVDKAKGGESDSLNCGVNISRYSLVAQTDVRFLVDASCLRKASGEMASDKSLALVFSPNETISYEGAKATLFERLSTADYLRELLLSPAPGGAYRSRMHFVCGFALVDKETAIKAGGYRRDARFPAYSQATAIHCYLREIGSSQRIKMLTEPVCSYFADYDLRTACNQASMRSGELMRSMRQWRAAFLNPDYKKSWALSYPYYALTEIAAPALELAGLVLLPVSTLLGVPVDVLGIYFLSTMLGGAALSLLASAALAPRFAAPKSAGASFALAFAAVLSQFGYRQIMALSSVKGWAPLLFRRPAKEAMRSSAYTPPS